MSDESNRNRFASGGVNGTNSRSQPITIEHEERQYLGASKGGGSGDGGEPPEVIAFVLPWNAESGAPFLSGSL